MTEIKKIEGFTPGPWVVENGGQDLWIGTGKNEGTKVDDIVVHIENGTEYKESVRLKNHANSDLIAYAPELYRIALDQQKEIERLRRFVESLAEWTDEQCSWNDAGVRARGSAQNLLNNL